MRNPRCLFRAALCLSALAVLRPALIAAAASAASPAPAADAVSKLLNPGTRLATPKVAPASDEAAQAIQRMKLAAGLKISLWAAEPMLANPVAFTIDERGRIFVAETYRYRSSTLDIRDYMQILEDELANRNLADFSAMIARRFGPEGVKELSIETEVLRLVEDRNHDGVADFSTIYADGFNSPLDGIASGALARRGDVWFTNMPSLWHFTGEDKAVTREEVSRGYGIRFNFTGHDLHGLAFGPDGKIYFSVGDRAAHATGPDGAVVDTPDAGAVFRMNRDGTHLEIFARGLRNPQSLAFTENGDLFTGDNDSDQTDEERLVHVVENGDSGWRIGYQYAPLGRGGPWITEKLWLPRTPETPAYLLSPIFNLEDGPSGIDYYPGTGLNPSYAGTFFITHFTGSPARAGIFTYKVKPSGASYAPAAAGEFLTSALPTDAKFGPDGRLYFSDWGDGWLQSSRGRIYAISDPTQENNPLIKETQQLLGGNWTARSNAELTRLLGHADWRVRLEAQYTLAERGAPSQKVLAGVAADTRANSLARRHALWGLGQLAERTPAALSPVKPLLKDRDAEVRAQAAKLLGDHGVSDTAEGLVAALRDPENRVKFFAAQSLGKLKYAPAVPALLDALRANADKDEYLRHALVMGLVGANDFAALQAAATDASRSVRLGVLLALRRLGSPAVQRFLADADPYLVREAAIAINDAPIAAAYPAVAALLDRSTADESVALRAINAHFRLGGAENAAALARFAARSGVPDKLRFEALEQLANWENPPARDRLVGIYRPLAERTRDAAVARDAVAPVAATLLDAATPAQVQTAAITVVEKYRVGTAAPALFAVVGNAQQTISNRIAALNTLDKLNDPRLAEAVRTASAAQEPRLRLAALPIIGRLDPVRAVETLGVAVSTGTIEERKLAFEILGSLDHPLAEAVLVAQLRLLADGTVPAAAQLELLEAAAKKSGPEPKRLLAERAAALAARPDPLAIYSASLSGGDSARGKKVFDTQPVMACVRCHRVGTEGSSEVGPNLANIGQRQTREQLLESIIKPNARYALGFEAVLLTRQSGATLAGTVTAETDTVLTVRDADGKVTEVPKSDIARRGSAQSAMPEIYAAALSPGDLRDVIEYLAGLRPPGGGRGSGAPAAAAAAAGRAGRGGAATGDAAGVTGGTAPTPSRVMRALRNVVATPAPAAKAP
jgi:quinoprotein glucose dehydrogenase